MACNHTYRDYTKMTVEEMVSYIVQDGKIQSTFSETTIVTVRWLAPCVVLSWATRSDKRVLKAKRILVSKVWIRH